MNTHSKIKKLPVCERKLTDLTKFFYRAVYCLGHWILFAPFFVETAAKCVAGNHRVTSLLSAVLIQIIFNANQQLCYL